MKILLICYQITNVNKILSNLRILVKCNFTEFQTIEIMKSLIIKVFHYLLFCEKYKIQNFFLANMLLLQRAKNSKVILNFDNLI